ncbi:hypothetical protein [Kamptonema formosum]|uniref:hypothetical protein n=1 Tax=Kamptonema formosum TaxID=331992 RepID=UPI000382C409|nr:hypothetical protein [Oscillatoria sp. PCC 10802]
MLKKLSLWAGANRRPAVEWHVLLKERAGAGDCESERDSGDRGAGGRLEVGAAAGCHGERDFTHQSKQLTAGKV